MRYLKYILAIITLFLTKGYTQNNYNMGNGTITIPCGVTHNFYDSGGSGGNYNNSENFTLTIVAGSSGSCVSVSFSAFNTESGFDFLSIYDGPNTAAPLIGTYAGSTLPPTIISSSGSLTFRFTSDGSVVYSGWAAAIQCIPCPPPPILMANGSTTVNCSQTFNFFDSGGSAGNYGNNQNFTHTFYPGTNGQCLVINFTSFATEANNDVLSIYNGSNTAAPIVGQYSGSSIISSYTSSGGPITITFTSNASTANSGWAANISCGTCVPPSVFMNNTNATLTCPGTYLFYDSGGSGGNYANNENFTKTIFAPAGSCLQVQFGSFSTESCCDRLRIFNGPNGLSPLIGTYAGAAGPGLVQSSGTALTFSFTSDGSVVSSGWTATITCLNACSGTPVGGTATLISTPCPPVGSVNVSVINSAVGCGLTYQWQSSSSSSGPWANISAATNATYTGPSNSSVYYRRIISCGSNSAVSIPVLGATTGVTCSPFYSASSITYSFTSFSGNLTPTTDDILFNNTVMFGFPVCYSGGQFWGGYIAANCAFVLDAVPCVPNIQTNTFAAPNVATGWQITQPAPNSSEPPRNAILAPWHDIYPPAGGIIQYTTVGTAPNRVFIASWENIPLFSCTTLTNTSQIKIFETTNIIEIHVGRKQTCTSFNNGQAILGLHNYNGTVYTPPVNATAHNAALNPATNHWSITNTAYRFTPNSCAGGGNGCLVLPITLLKFYGERKEKVNHLYWETSSETEIRNYIIERSTDAVNFTAIGNQDPKHEASKYEFKDYEAKSGITNYYRIAVENENGTVDRTYIYPLGPVSDDILTVLSVYPNPSQSDFNIAIESKVQSEIKTRIHQVMGNEARVDMHTIKKGFNLLNLNVSDLPKGVYILSIENDLNEVISKIKIIIN